MSTPTAIQLLRVARSQIGYREGSNNDNKYGRWYGANNQPWCAMFVSWVAAASGAVDIIPRHAYTPSGAQWFKSRNLWGLKPRVGAVVYFNFPGDGVDRISHVGFVEKVNADGSIVTIEGNTNDGGSREGNGVYRKVRRVGIVGYGYPRYAKPAPQSVPYPGPLRKGSRGTAVARLQRKLIAKGYRIPSIQSGRARPGFWGAETERAWVAYRRKHPTFWARYRGKPVQPREWNFLINR